MAREDELSKSDSASSFDANDPKSLVLAAIKQAYKRALARKSEMMVDHKNELIDLTKAHKLEDELRAASDPTVLAGNEFAEAQQDFDRYFGLSGKYNWFNLEDIFCKACQAKHDNPQKPVEYDLSKLETGEYSPDLDCAACKLMQPRFLDVRKGETFEILEKYNPDVDCQFALEIPAPPIQKQRLHAVARAVVQLERDSKLLYDSFKGLGDQLKDIEDSLLPKIDRSNSAVSLKNAFQELKCFRSLLDEATKSLYERRSNDRNVWTKWLANRKAARQTPFFLGHKANGY